MGLGAEVLLSPSAVVAGLLEGYAVHWVRFAAFFSVVTLGREVLGPGATACFDASCVVGDRDLAGINFEVRDVDQMKRRFVFLA